MNLSHPVPTVPAASEASGPLPGISVVICTYNRADLLLAALDDVLAQDHPDTPAFELIVVDNNSSDTTAAVVRAVAARDARVRYLFEAQQGLSHARNAAIAAARAPIVAFTDDDVRVGRAWLAEIARAFREHPGATVVGGRVLPVWPAPPPPWLTAAHWGPLALVDYGEHPIRVDATRQLCLVGANLAVAASAFERVGTFAPAVQRVRDIVGSSEDHEFLQRLFRAGGFGVYDAPEPWGPWTTAYFTNTWDDGPGETASFPTKWMSADGKTVHLVFSGDDHFSVRKATLTTAGDK